MKLMAYMAVPYEGFLYLSAIRYSLKSWQSSASGMKASAYGSTRPPKKYIHIKPHRRLTLLKVLRHR